MQSGTVPTSNTVNADHRVLIRRRWRRRFFVGLCALIVVYASHPTLLAWAGHWLNVGERLDVPVDCVYVLGGESSTRPFMAAAIYRAGYTRMVLIPEGQPSATDADRRVLGEHEIQREVLLRRGVPVDAIQQLPGPVNSTRDEARALEKFMATNPTSSVAVVTSDFHTRRTRLIFRRLLRDHRDRLHFVATPTDGFGPDSWWYFKDGLIWYVGEYAKLSRDFFW